MENIEQTYEEQVEKYKTMWNTFSYTYYNSLNKNLLSLMTSMIALTRVSDKTTILEVGCGPGLETKILSAGISNLNSTVYALDFSPEIIKICNEVFSNYLDFNCNINNHWEIASFPSNNKVNISEDTKEIRLNKKGKIVKFFEGNAENLIFEDEQFEVYLSSLCLMLCIDVDRAISESYRVLKSGGVASFSIWGKKEESKLIVKLFQDVFINYGVDLSTDKTSFWLAEDTEALKEKLLQVGYKEIRMEYTTQIYDCYDEEDFLIKFSGPMIKKGLALIKDQTLVPHVLEEIKAGAKKCIVEQKIQPTLNCLIIVAFK